MKHKSLAVIGAALTVLCGCVAYPADRQGAHGDRGDGPDRARNDVLGGSGRGNNRCGDPY